MLLLLWIGSSVLLQGFHSNRALGLGVAGVWLALLYVPAIVEWRLRKPAATAVLALLTVEELLTLAVISATSLVRNDHWRDPVSVSIFFAGCGVLILLWLRVRFPEGALPLRGLWLRRLVAVLALFALVDWPMWSGLYWRSSRPGELPWLLVLGVAALYYLLRAADYFAKRSFGYFKSAAPTD